MFSGGNPENLPETEGKMRKWQIIFELFEYGKNPRYGHLEHLPVAGGLLNQPAKTMEALDILSTEYQKKLAEKMQGAIHR